MTSLLGHDRQMRTFLAAMSGQKAHHAWILAGPRGLGKASFARAAALHMLSLNERPGGDANEFYHDADGQAAHLLAAGSHPDFRWLRRPPRNDAAKKKAEDNGIDALDESELGRNIKVDQIRSLLPVLSGSAAIAPYRVIVIDAADDLERSGSNALLKSLEEPPPQTLFLLVSHAPDRLLPTIRSRCQILRFDPLADGDIGHILEREHPELDGNGIDTIVRAAKGSPGLALQYAQADLPELDARMSTIAQQPDSHSESIALARKLNTKAANARYRAFLSYAPRFAAMRIRQMPPELQGGAVDLWREILSLTESAAPKSLEPQMVVFRICGLMGRLGAHR